ncbi:MAG: Ig-like domain-containing protein [Planctomycetota bacterium]|nr:Ig-like domain-containing protein [Planctomycetota bacterium]
MHRSRFFLVLGLVLVLGASVSMTSCGGGAGGTNPDLVLLGFNVPNLSGIALNQPLIFTFSASINPATITPDSLRVVGVAGPFFESTIVDGNLVALMPTVPNFANYSDAGYAPNTQYTVSLTEFPAVTTIESTTGKPLLAADSYTFRTLPAPSPDIVSNIRCNGPDGILGTADDTSPTSASFFIEPRRAIRHGTPPSSGGQSDDQGCLQNSGHPLYVSPLVDPSVIQAGSGVGARLLCLQNEGSPRVIAELCTPLHNAVAIGTPSAVTVGFIDLPAIRVKVNEPLDPLTVEPFAGGVPFNVQLWRVALKDGTPTGPDQISTNKPIVVQDTGDAEIILVPAGPVPQGTFLVNITPAVRDLPGCPLRINDRPNPAVGGYDQYEGLPAFTAAIQPGYRLYFKTLEVPDTPLSIIEDFNNNLAEWGDNLSGTSEPGVYTASNPDVGDLTFDGLPLFPTAGVAPSSTRTFDAATDAQGILGGQSTTALWNGSGVAVPGNPIASVNGYRFLNIPTLSVSSNPINQPAGRLLHVREPYCGTGQDGAFDSGGGGSSIGVDTTNGSVNGDGVFEYISFFLRATDTLSVSGSRPLLILCQGDFIVEGTITLDALDGGHGFDADGTAFYTNPGAVSTAGLGGQGGPGGGAGGLGAETLAINPGAPATNGNAGGAGNSLFDSVPAAFPGTTAAIGGGGFTESAAGANDGNQGGGGGGFSASGSAGSSAAGSTSAFGGIPYGDAFFTRLLAAFQPDRGYQPSANATGGGGGAGGGIEDDDGASETGNATSGPGDDGGAGGGGGGGAIWVIAKGAIEIRAGALISANGGRGGNTYGPADQARDIGPDGNPNTADDVFVGLHPNAGPVGTGQGGPGGGGAGGAIHLIGKGGVAVAVGATLRALGGAGGSSNHAARFGGAGAPGRIAAQTFAGGPPPSVLGTVTPGAAIGFWSPTILDMSVGQSEWVDLFTPTVTFSPLVAGTPQPPTFAGNFAFPGAAFPGFLETPQAMGGGGQSYGFPGGNFDARLEFQGADFLLPEPDLGTPTTADGLTTWVDVSSITSLNNKRFFRWRWRFWTDDDYGSKVTDPLNLPVPSIYNLTIPFIK